MQEHDTTSHLMLFFRRDEDEDDRDDELMQHLRNREPSETEPAVFTNTGRPRCSDLVDIFSVTYLKIRVNPRSRQI
ncbi:MAG: hypothetical protein OXN25_09230 [Candidatus Poribacteria bacterium]|nr:hypothetical protein [Candidatus Poribacteria bacterium]